MEEGELYVSVPFIQPDNTIEYATILVQVRPNMTMNELDVEIHDAINAVLLSQGQDVSGRLSTLLTSSGVDLLETSIGEYAYGITGFVAGGEFFSF